MPTVAPSAYKDASALLAPAKVNLHLGIHPGRDERGYHRADSIMIPLELGNGLVIERAEAPEAVFEPALSIPVEKSVVYRAVDAFERTFTPGCSWRASVTRLTPGSAGLGSSSADAGAVLRELARIADVPSDDKRLVAIAQSLGADVAFFLQGSPALLGGVGDVLERTFPHVSMEIALVKPEVGVSTVEAYRAFDEHPVEPADPSDLAAALDAGDIPAIAAHLANNLAPAAIELAPEVGECLAWLRAQDGVLGAQVTGSGSCSFAICATASDAERIAAASPWWARATRTI